MYIDIKKGTVTRKYWWVAKGGNHEPLAHSEQYTAKQSAKDTIAVLKRGARNAPVYDRTGEAGIQGPGSHPSGPYFSIHKNADGYWWNVRGANHEILAHSEGYTSKQSAKTTIAVIKRDASSASVYDETGEVSGGVDARRIYV